MQFVIPMYESERGWGGRTDGYAGPFDTITEAREWMNAYNLKFNNEPVAPDWYIVAEPPIEYTGQVCTYRLDLV